ncbi:MAG TPA: flagellar biosynthetic protein FliO [Anaeromyxobacteraceae bacterium]|nr:flagellar biosynthetic protein FliO [Anaeromyxobacteraceae bacterium]
MSAPRWPRLLGDPRGRAAALGIGAAAAFLLALAPGELAPAAARAAAAVGGLGALVALARSRSPRGPSAGGLSVLEARPLGRDAGIAVVEVSGRRMLVGFGPSGVRRLADLGRPPEDHP